MNQGKRVMNWKLPKQRFLVEKGHEGDCWRCCVAAVLQIPWNRVPHFNKISNHLTADTQRWLNKKGYVLVGGKITFPRWHGDEKANLPVIACGPTPRSRGIGKHHAVVMVDDKIVYDPHPSEAGLTAITDSYIIVKPL
jgi:hypothetical protein